MKKHYRAETDCLNCGTKLEGKFCHHCGQENLEIKESFGHMMNHAISDYFHFDHQFFHTIKPLLFKPGFLTTQYMAGKRMQYLHPVKMYIFISLVYFLVLFQIRHETVKKQSVAERPGLKKALLDSMGKEVDKDKSLTPAEKEQIKQKAKKYAGGIITVVDDDEDNSGNSKTGIFSTTDTSYAQYLSEQQKLPADKRDNVITSQIRKRVLIYKQKYGPLAKEMFMEDFRHNIPKMMFLILPLLALILKITFAKNKKFYVEHLIYSFHLHCFFYLFLTLIMLIELVVPESWSLPDWLNLAATVYVIWYIYRSLRVVYNRNKLRTITKMIGISVMYSVAIIFGISLVLLVTGLLAH